MSRRRLVLACAHTTSGVLSGHEGRARERPTERSCGYNKLPTLQQLSARIAELASLELPHDGREASTVR
mgnify:CR=1 FL=1